MSSWPRPGLWRCNQGGQPGPPMGDHLLPRGDPSRSGSLEEPVVVVPGTTSKQEQKKSLSAQLPVPSSPSKADDSSKKGPLSSVGVSHPDPVSDDARERRLEVASRDGEVELEAEATGGEGGTEPKKKKAIKVNLLPPKTQTAQPSEARRRQEHPGADSFRPRYASSSPPKRLQQHRDQDSPPLSKKKRSSIVIPPPPPMPNLSEEIMPSLSEDSDAMTIPLICAVI